MKIGIVIAEKSEMLPVMNRLGVKYTETIDGFEVAQCDVNKNTISHQRLYMVLSGVGEINAGTAAQMLITRYDVDLIVNIGTCGALSAEMPALSWGLVDRVVHYDFDTNAVTGRPKGAYPGQQGSYIRADEKYLERSVFTRNLACKRLICASGDKFLSDPAEKRHMAEQFEAQICEMEAAGILLTANRCGVPAIILKVVSDGSEGGAEEYDRMAGKAAELCAEILKVILEVQE